MAKDIGAGSYEVLREGQEVVLKLDYENSMVVPSIEDNGAIMAKIIDALVSVGTVSKIVLMQKRDYEYDYSQCLMLREIAKIYREHVKDRLQFKDISDASCPLQMQCITARMPEVQKILFRLLKTDPVGAFVETRRLLRRERIKCQHLPASQQPCLERYLKFLGNLQDQLAATQILTIAKPYLPGFHLGNRAVYRKIFSPSIKPDFMYTKLVSAYPVGAEELAGYWVDGTEVTIFKLPDTIQTRYHMIPPEFKLDEIKYELLDNARRVLVEHQPTKEEFTDPKRMRDVFHNIGLDLIEELAEHRGVHLKLKELEELTRILTRYTVGFGLIEVLLGDEQVQDITINSPLGRIPMFIVHGEFGDCVTNIYPTVPESESWASKLRMLSGRPLDEANPILDTGLSLPNAEARVAVISPPLNPYGLSYAFRRHRDKPWTLPLFIKARMISELGAGLMSFLIDGSRTLLIAGTRSAGKTSFLTSLLIEIMRRSRIITLEDTLELPVTSLRNLGYNIQPMKVASSMSKGTAEVSAAEGIRTTLRMGDSALIIGEVRSDEARALYEAMRVGALANVVAGTIHGDSPYGVFDRVVNDLNVPRTSFKATDIIVVANPIRSPDGLSRWRRITQITEVRKFWERDPLTEGGFVDLMKYSAKTDMLEPTDELINGDSDILKSIGGNVKEWASDWDAIWDNVVLRGNIKKAIVDISEAAKDPSLLEAEFVVLCNDQFHKISSDVREEVGSLDSKKILFRFNDWIKRAVRKRRYL